jgi:hypothetical protein
MLMGIRAKINEIKMEKPSPAEDSNWWYLLLCTPIVLKALWNPCAR